MRKLEGRAAIVTGAGSGLGYAIAKAFLAEGARVVICGRNAPALSAAAAELSEISGRAQDILAVSCDVADERQVGDLVAQAVGRFGAVDVLVNNAAILGPMGAAEAVSLDEWRSTFEINYFGVVLCCRALLPHFRARAAGKIINLSGGGATSPRPFFSAYATSKAAVVRFTENLAEELQGTGIDVNAVAPGALNTRMLDQALAAGPERVGNMNYDQALRQHSDGGSSLATAADLCVYLAGSESDGITGRLISAPWDSWRGLHTRLAELRATDVFTLRRVVPADRAKSW